MAPPKRAQLQQQQQQQGGVFPSSCKINKVPIVRHVEPFFVETDIANFKAVVQILTGHQQTSQSLGSLGFLDNVHVFPPLSHSHAIPEIDNLVVAAEVEIKEISFGVDNICTSSFVGFETETIDSFSGDMLFQNHDDNDAFDLIPWTSFEEDISWDSFLLTEY